MKREPSGGNSPGVLAPGLLGVLLVADGFLVAAHLLFPRTLLFDFNLDVEGNVPTWFSALQLGIVAVALGLAGVLERGAPASRRRALPWFAGSALFGALSLDEIQQVHETAGFHLSLSPWAVSFSDRLAAALPGAGQLRGMLWVLLLAPVIVLVLAWLAWFARGPLGSGRREFGFAAAGLALFGAALACEAVSLWDFGTRYYRFQVALEEGGELVGGSLFAAAAVAALEERLRRCGLTATRRILAAGLRLRRAVRPLAAAAGALAAAGWLWAGMPLDTGAKPEGWRATGTPCVPASRAAFAFDRDPYSAWTTAAPMRGVEWFELDLGRVRRVRQVCLFVGGLRLDHPRRLEVESTADGAVWMRWPEPPRGGRAWNKTTCVDLPVPVAARRLRFRQLGSARIYHWSIAEIFVR